MQVRTEQQKVASVEVTHVAIIDVEHLEGGAYVAHRVHESRDIRRTG